MINVSSLNVDRKNDGIEKSNLEIAKSMNVSLDAGSISDVMNTSSVNEGSKNESQESSNLSKIVTNSSDNTVSNDNTVNVENGAINSSSTNGLDSNMKTENRQNSRRRLLEETSFKGAGDGSENVQTATVENDNALEAEADSSFDLFRGSDELADEYNYDYDDYVDENMWGDEDWTESQHETVEDYVDIDSHILSTPVSAIIVQSLVIFQNKMSHILNIDSPQVIADIDNDGVSEMVVAVSYFFDRE